MKIKNALKSVCKIVALVALTSVISLEAPYAHRLYIRNIAESSAVQIYGVEGTGSGAQVTLEDGSQVILTNKHICQMTGPLKVKAEGRPLAVARKIVKISDEHDLCALEPLSDMDGIKVGSAPEKGDEVYTLGHPRGDALNVAKGEYFDDKVIEMGEDVKEDGTCAEGSIKSVQTIFGEIQYCAYKRNTIQVSSPTYPGNSGSPVVNKYGRLIGVIFAGNREVENNGFAVPLSYVKEFLKSL